MKKRGIIISIILMLAISLCGCVDRDFTSKDADRFAKKYSKKFEYLGEETVSEKDTIWRYHDKTFDFDFFVEEHPYTAGIDGSSWAARTLVTNYDTVLIEKEFLTTDIGSRADVAEGTSDYYGKKLTYNVRDRQDLENTIKEIKAELKKLNKKTGRKKYKGELSFDLGYLRAPVDDITIELDEVEDYLLKVSFVDSIDEYLDQYTEKELQDYVKGCGSQVYFITGAREEATGMVVFGGTNFIKKEQLYKYLVKRGDCNATLVDDVLTYTDLNGEVHELKGNDRLGFWNIPKQFNCDRADTK